MRGVRQLLIATIALGAALLWSVPVRAQVTTADVVGRVTDPSGAVVPNAKVTIQNTGTGAVRSMNTTESGDYVFNLLPIGSYTIHIEVASFRTFTRQGLELAAGDRVRVDTQMEVGTTSESVMVTAEAPMLQTDTSSVSTLMSGKAVQDIPLNGRNWVQLAQLAPGVTPGPGNGLSTGTRPDDRRQNSSFSVNGQDPVVNNNMIDGMDNNERVIGTIGVKPSIDAIAEFTVQINMYSAEIGRTSGGVVNILTKSGNNQFHGSLFEYLRNDLFDANPFYNFTNVATNPPKPEYRQNQFGGSIGGPIRKDRTFFFGDYEELRIIQGQLVANGVVVPTAKQRAGDFSESCTAGFDSTGLCANRAQQISLAAALGGAPAGAVPFNRLNQGPYSNLLSPLALKIINLVPLPNAPGVTSPNFNNFANRAQTARTFDARIDHHLNEKTTVYGRYSFNDVTTLTPTGFPDAGDLNPGGNFNGSFPGPNTTRAQNAQLNLVHVFRPDLVLELKGGYTRAAMQSLGINAGKNAATELGFPCNAASCINTGDIQTFGLPQLNIQGFQGLGDATFVPLLQFDNTFQYNGALTWTHNSHNIKFGAALIRRQFSIAQSQTARGSFSFNGSTTAAPAPVVNGLPGTANPFASTTDGTVNNANNSGAGLANFLLGAPVTVARNVTPGLPGYRSWEPGVYVQDDWRVNRWLTLNLGMRYDIFTPKTEVHNRESNFDPVTRLMLLPGSNASASAGVATDYGNVAPRIGFAATIGRGMVLRGGYGLTYFPGDYTSQAFLKNPPLTYALNCGSSTTGNIVNTGCPAGFGTLAQGVPVPSTTFPTTSTSTGPTLDLTQLPITVGLRAVATDFQASYEHQFNVTLERQIGSNVVSAGYIGQRGRDLVMDLPDINRALPSGISTPNPRPFASLNKVSSIEYLTTHGTSSYNAMQLSFQRRFSRGLSLTSGYTYAHGIDDITALSTGTGAYGTAIGPTLAQAVANTAINDRSTSDFNIRNRWTVAANYELPFGKKLSGAAAEFIRGWQVNGSGSWQNGLPFNVTNQANVSGIIGIAGERPDRVKPDLLVSNPTAGIGGQWLDPTAFHTQAPFTLGNAARNIVYGPNWSTLNLSVFKNFKLREGWNLQFRAESFNFLNHPNFGNPNGTFGSPTFGKITTKAPGSAGDPRQLQFALKLLF
ncbi:MAG: TonB-dependent receptor [Acidobacteriia bacterium]|nr:TonB-dependent receptor [Terriglobia bacterium]